MSAQVVGSGSLRSNFCCIARSAAFRSVPQIGFFWPPNSRAAAAGDFWTLSLAAGASLFSNLENGPEGWLSDVSHHSQIMPILILGPRDLGTLKVRVLERDQNKIECDDDSILFVLL